MNLNLKKGKEGNVNNPSKPLWQSKTFWLNVIGFILFILPTITSLNVIDPKLLGGILAVLNVINRYFTTQPVTLL